MLQYIRRTKSDIMSGVDKEGLIKSKLVARNTVKLLYRHGIYIIRVHHTNIILHIPYKEAYELYSGGYHTKLTRKRINEFSPANIIQEKGKWYVLQSDGEMIPFYEGIAVCANGDILNTINRRGK